MNEIDKDYFCSAGAYVKPRDYLPTTKCHFSNGLIEFSDGVSSCVKNKCSCYHRKYPTIKQFKQEYGKVVPENMPVWVLDREWVLMTWLEYQKGYLQNIMSADIEFGRTVPFVVVGGWNIRKVICKT